LATSSNDTITNSEISTTSASYVRQRSASALTINQSTATNTDTRVKVTAGTGMVHSSWLIHQISGLNDADLSWVTSSAAFKIYQSGSLSWNAGTLKCSGTLTDDNNSTVSCSGGTISPSTQYRVDVQLMNTAPVAASMQGTGDAVALKNITGGWGGTTPLFNDAAFYDPASGGVDGATTAATSTSGNDFRLTNTGAGNVVIGALTGFEGFMFLITTGSDVPTTDSTGFASTTIDAISEDSSKITISGPTVSVTQRAFIFQNDDGSEVNGNSNSGSANTTSTPVKKGERLIARFQIDETGGGATSTTLKLQYNTGWNSNSWVDVMGSGPPSTNSGASTTDWNATTVDSTSAVGSYTSIAIGTDGLPIVSYYDTTNLNLNIAKCNTEPCTTSSNWSTTSVDGFQGSDVGGWTSIAIGADGLPIVSYYDSTNGNLNIAKCTTEPCTTQTNWSTTTPDSTGNVGQYTTSIAIGTDGLPVVSYYDNTNDNLNIAKCNTSPCTQSNQWSTTTPDSTGTVGYFTSIAIGTDGLPIVSYNDITNGNLNIAKCDTSPCTQSNQWSTTSVDGFQGGDVGYFTSIAIGRDGFPIISYQDITNAAMKIAKCNDMACSGGDEAITTVNDLGDTINSGGYNSIAIGKDGWPWVSYFDDDNDDLKVAHMSPLAEIQPALGLSGANGAALTSAAIAGGTGTWQNGEWYEATTTSRAITLAANYYTELAFVLDTREATASTTYRLRLVQSGGGLLNGGYANYPAFTIVSSTDNKMRYSKEAILTGASNASTSDWNATTVDSTGTVGYYTSIAIGTDGLPVVSYRDVTNGNLNIAKCNTEPCTTATNWSTTTPDSISNVGQFTSIAIGTDGLPVVSYRDVTNGNLNIAKCNTEPCTTATNW
ncbi:MAG: hypothetical protein Q7J73_05460, partial [Dehalococcoidales bacterium]|nr:hypothetical protein [Dehalococcoidales bacterium]